MVLQESCSNWLKVSWQIVCRERRVAQALAGGVNFLYSNANSKKVTFPPAFLPYKEAGVKYNSQHSLK